MVEDEKVSDAQPGGARQAAVLVKVQPRHGLVHLQVGKPDVMQQAAGVVGVQSAGVVAVALTEHVQEIRLCQRVLGLYRDEGRD